MLAVLLLALCACGSKGETGEDKCEPPAVSDGGAQAEAPAASDEEIKEGRPTDYDGTTVRIEKDPNTGETSLTMSAEDVSVTTNDYDPATGTCTFSSEGITIYLTFTESGGSVTLHYTYDELLDDGRTYGHATGRKL